jgi:hypothetical protein
MAFLTRLLRLIGQTRPLLFFTLPGLLVLAGGLVAGAWVIDQYAQTEELAVGTALLAVMLTIVGHLALFTGVILHSLRGFIFDFIRKG